MSEQVVTAPADATIRQAANLMRGRGIGCLAVVADEKPVGIVTITDLLELIGRGVERPIERSTRWTLHRAAARATRVRPRVTRAGADEIGRGAIRDAPAARAARSATRARPTDARIASPRKTAQSSYPRERGHLHVDGLVGAGRVLPQPFGRRPWRRRSRAASNPQRSSSCSSCTLCGPAARWLAIFSGAESFIRGDDASGRLGDPAQDRATSPIPIIRRQDENVMPPSTART